MESTLLHIVPMYKRRSQNQRVNLETMPVTFKAANHNANPVEAPYKPISNADELLASTWGQEAMTMRSKELLQTSLSSAGAETQDWDAIQPRNNGFVHTLITAYNTLFYGRMMCGLQSEDSSIFSKCFPL